MNKLIKKLLVFALVLVLTASIVPLQRVSAAVSTEQALSWARGKVGFFYDFDGVAGAQCVDLIYGYYSYLGAPIYYGNGCDFIGNSAAVPAGWTRIPVTTGFVPQPGDIAVWYANHSCDTCITGWGGHVGIITSADAAGFNAVNQSTALGCHEKWFWLSSLACVIRPNLQTGPALAVTKEVSCKFKVTIPANYYVTLYDSATSTTPSRHCFYEKPNSFTLSCTAKLIMNDGSTRYKFVTNDDPVTLYLIYDAGAMSVTENHTYGFWSITKKSTCTATGIMSRECACGAKQQQTTPAKGHSYGDWEITKKVTCTENGIQTRKCSCGAKQQETLYTLGHCFEHVFTVDVTPTCDNIGLKSRHCINCVMVTDMQTIPATGHEYDEWQITAIPWIQVAECTQCKNTINDNCPQNVYSQGWNCINNRWYYLQNNTFLSGWLCDGAWYYMQADCTMATGWINDGAWYYLNDSGMMVTGWINDGGTWYYLNSSGAMATGWINDGSAWYYLSGSGAMATGWINDGGVWYYLNGSGTMVTGWQFLDGAWYYFYQDGSMAANCYVDGYWLTASGSMA